MWLVAAARDSAPIGHRECSTTYPGDRRLSVHRAESGHKGDKGREPQETAMNL